MNKRLRIILVWTIVSLALQFGFYSLLNNQLQKVMNPETPGLITLQLEASIPGTDLTNIQISYAKDYLAYTEDGTLKVFNLKKKTIVFEKDSPSASDDNLGVLNYQWLPDRSTLLYFYAKKNPNPITYVTKYPTKSTQRTTTQSSSPKTDDPNEKPVQEVPKVTSAKPRTVKIYNNPQITELYALDLPESNEDIAPDDQLKRTIDEFPAGGKIEEWVNSTATNLMYLTIKSGSHEQLMEIDIMKDVKTLNKSGEAIDNMAASDRYGTLYLDSQVGDTRKVVGLNGTKRYVISTNADDRILGIRDGKVYIGEVENDQLVKLKTTEDLSDVQSNPTLKTEWEGSIPFDDTQRTIIGADGQTIVYDHQTANIITNGQLKKLDLQGDESYISVDGAELIQLTRGENSTEAELQPLNS